MNGTRHCQAIIASLVDVLGQSADVEVSNYYYHLGTTYVDLMKLLHPNTRPQRGT